MNKNDLKKLRALRAERDDLARRIRNNQFKPEAEMADTVKDYRTGQGKTIVIRGYGNSEWAKLQSRYKNSYGLLVRKILLLESFLQKVEDPETRTILRLKYEDGKSYEEIGSILGFSRQAIQKKEKLFWESQK